VQAAELLDAARRRFAELGATRELLPVEVIHVLLAAAAGAHEEAADIARRLAEAASAGRPECLPVWAAVTTLWAGLGSETGDVVEFGEIGWLDAPEATRQRWLEPLRRLGRGSAEVGAPAVPTWSLASRNSRRAAQRGSHSSSGCNGRARWQARQVLPQQRFVVAGVEAVEPIEARQLVPGRQH
jgi:hypothetical protein